MRRELKVEFRPGAEPMQQATLGELELPGEDGSYVSTPHVAALGITAELDVRIDLTHQRWGGDRQQTGTPGALFAHQPLVAKYVTSGNQRSWVFYLDGSGQLGLLASADGIADEQFTSDRAPYVRGGGRTVVRATYESNVGGTSHHVRFYQGFSITGPWVLLSEHTETGIQALFNATGAGLEIGSMDGGGPTFPAAVEHPVAWLPQAMTVHRVQVRNGIDGTIVANPVFSGHAEGATSFTDSAGRLWTVNGNAHISADQPVPAWVTLSAGGPHGNRVQSAEWRIGRERDDDDWPPGEATLELKSPDRLFDPENSAGTYFGQLEPRVPFRLSAPDNAVSALNLPEARTFLDHPGASGDNVTCPASSQIAVAGDIDIRLRARLDDWAPLSSQRFLSRGLLASEGDFSWRWSVAANGVTFQWSPDGSASITVISSVPLVFTAGSEHWVRVTLRPDDGFGNHEVRFWVSETGGDGDWVEVGSPQTGTGFNRLWGGSRPLATGRLEAATNNLQGEVLQVEVRDGINGTIVANPDFTRLPPGITSFTDDRGNPWTVAGAAAVTLDTSTRSWVSTPDHADFSFSLTMRLRIEVSLEDWRPGHDVVLLSKWEETGNQRSWILALTGDGRLVGTHSTTGADEIVRTTTAQVTPGPAGRLTIEALLLTNFFGGSLWIFSTGTDGINGDVTELGQVIINAGSTTTIFDSTAPVEVGTFNAGTTSDPYRQLDGIVHAARLSDNGNTDADPDFTANVAGDPSVTDSTGKMWTLQGDAELVQDPAFVGDQFYGFVEDGWEQTYQHPADGYCTVKLTDLFGVLPGEVLPSPFEGAILDTSPSAYWRLNEAIGRTGEEVSDQSESQHTGQIVGQPEFGQPALFAGLGDAVLFDKGDQNDQVARIDISRSRIGRDPFNQAVVCVMRTSSRPPAQNWIDKDFIFHDTSGQVPVDIPNAASFAVFVRDDGTLRVLGRVGILGGSQMIGPVIDDDRPHLVFAQRNGLGTQDGIGVDTAVVDASSFAGGFPTLGIGSAVAGLANATGNRTDNQYSGILQHVAVWDRSLTQADRDHIFEHLAGLNGKRSDEQLRWALQRLGVPQDLIDLDEGITTMGVVDSGGKDALDFAREIDATEGGAFFVDHHNGGKLRFRNRYVRWLHHRSRIDQETFSDDPAATSVVRVEEGSLIIQPKGVSTVVNTWTVTWAGGEETATDAASRKRYGPRGDTIDTQAPSSAFARGLARFNLSLTKEPRTLVRGLGINPAAAEAGFPAAVNLQIWDRAGFRHQPLATGSVLTRALQIEGAKHQVKNMHWDTGFFTATAADEHQQLFLADISETDGDHVAAP